MASKTLSILSSTFLLLLLKLNFSHSHAIHPNNVVKSAYWSNTGFPLSSIDFTLFSHLFCAFAYLDPQKSQVTLPSSELPRFSTFTQTLRLKNPKIKTLLSIGGEATDHTTYVSMASQPKTQKIFIASSINVARSNNFHGLDLDWEFPSLTEEMANLGVLLTEWRQAVTEESIASGKPPLLLTAMVYYSSTYRSLAHPIEEISDSLDWINDMSLALYRSAWVPNTTQPPAGLYHPTWLVSGDSGIKAWINAGLAKDKIVLGLPLWGVVWTLLDSNNHGLFAPANVSAITESGGLAYFQIRDFMKNNKGVKCEINSSVVSDYCYLDTAWIGCELMMV